MLQWLMQPNDEGSSSLFFSVPCGFDSPGRGSEQIPQPRVRRSAEVWRGPLWTGKNASRSQSDQLFLNASSRELISSASNITPLMSYIESQGQGTKTSFYLLKQWHTFTLIWEFRVLYSSALARSITCNYLWIKSGLGPLPFYFQSWEAHFPNSSIK